MRLFANRYGNVIVQTLLILAAIMLAITILFNRDYVSVFFVVQLCLGLWQYVGCILTNAQAKSRKAKSYLRFSSAYLLLFFVGPYLSDFIPTAFEPLVYNLYLVIPPWILALYYYSIIARATFRNTNYKGFLPHLGF